MIGLTFPHWTYRGIFNCWSAFKLRKQLSVRENVLASPKIAMTSSASVHELSKQIEQLRRESAVQRTPISVTANDLKRYVAILTWAKSNLRPAKDDKKLSTSQICGDEDHGAKVPKNNWRWIICTTIFCKNTAVFSRIKSLVSCTLVYFPRLRTSNHPVTIFCDVLNQTWILLYL